MCVWAIVCRHTHVHFLRVCVCAAVELKDKLKRGRVSQFLLLKQTGRYDDVWWWRRWREVDVRGIKNQILGLNRKHFRFDHTSTTCVILFSWTEVERQIDKLYLMFYAQSTAKGETNCRPIPNTHTILIYYLKHHSTVEDLSQKMKFNEPVRQKPGRYRSLVSRHSIQSYILTYHRLKKREPLIALGSHQGGWWGGALISASAVPHCWRK